MPLELGASITAAAGGCPGSLADRACGGGKPGGAMKGNGDAGVDDGVDGIAIGA